MGVQSYDRNKTSLPPTMGYSFWKPLCKKSFLELEHLAFSWYGNPLALPSEFLGGSSSPRRLHNILLKGLYLPALPQLLSSSRDLVSLHLGYYTLTRCPLHESVCNNPAQVPSHRPPSSPYCIPPRIEESKFLSSQSRCSPHSYLLLLPLRGFRQVHGKLRFLDPCTLSREARCTP